MFTALLGNGRVLQTRNLPVWGMNSRCTCFVLIKEAAQMTSRLAGRVCRYATLLAVDGEAPSQEAIAIKDSHLAMAQRRARHTCHDMCGVRRARRRASGGRRFIGMFVTLSRAPELSIFSELKPADRCCPRRHGRLPVRRSPGCPPPPAVRLAKCVPIVTLLMSAACSVVSPSPLRARRAGFATYTLTKPPSSHKRNDDHGLEQVHCR